MLKINKTKKMVKYKIENHEKKKKKKRKANKNKTKPPATASAAFKHSNPILLLPLSAPMEPLLQFLLTLFALLVCASFFKRRTTNKKKTCDAPQAGGALPIIGHLHLLGSRQLTHKTLGAMADKYGPVFTLWLGSHRALVLSSWEMARECFTVHDKVLSTRSTKHGCLKVVGL